VPEHVLVICNPNELTHAWQHRRTDGLDKDFNSFIIIIIITIIIIIIIIIKQLMTQHIPVKTKLTNRRSSK